MTWTTERCSSARRTSLWWTRQSMVDARNTHKLFSYAAKAGAKVIMQGTWNSFSPSGRARGFQLTKQAVGDAKLTEIRRQGKQEDRETALSFYATDGGQIIDLKGQPFPGPDPRQGQRNQGGCSTPSAKRPRRRTPASACCTNTSKPNPMQEKLVIAHTVQTWPRSMRASGLG